MITELHKKFDKNLHNFMGGESPVDILILSLQPGCSANVGCSANFDKSTWHRKLGIAKFGKKNLKKLVKIIL